MSVQLHPTPETLPEGACNLITSEQDRLNLYSLHQTIYVPETYTGIIVSAASPTDYTKAWLKLDDLGRPVRVYYFSFGKWLSQHPLVPGHIMIWNGTLPDFTTFDGGDALASSDISGAMWEEVVDIRCKFPIGAGTFTAPSTTVINVTDTGGVETVTLTSDQMPPHIHHFTVNAYAASDSGVGSLTGGSYSSATVDGSYSADVESTGGDSATPPATVAHTNMPPYYGVYFLRRTARLFYSET